MGRSGSIEHTGVVAEITDASIMVKVSAQSACVSCKAHSICGVDTAEKLIEVNCWSGDYTPGEIVKLYMKESLGMKALAWGYLIPFVLVFSVLLSVLIITESEGLAGILSVSIMLPYFLLLYVFRNRFKKSFTFEISKLK